MDEGPYDDFFYWDSWEDPGVLVDDPNPPDDSGAVDDSGAADDSTADDPSAQDDGNFDVSTIDSEWWNDTTVSDAALGSGFLNDLPLGDDIAYDVANDAWYDRDSGQWFDIDGNALPGMDGLEPREENLAIGATNSDQLSPSDVYTGPGFFDSVGDFFKGLLGGSSSGGSGGGGSPLGSSKSSSQQAGQQVKSAQDQLKAAQQSGASAATLAALRLQLAQANAAFSSAQKNSTLIGYGIIGAAAVGLIFLLRPETAHRRNS